MNDKEALIRERREIEATRKNLMGPAGKLGTIVKHFGTTIESESGAYYQCTPLEDPFESDREDTGILDWDMDSHPVTIGWIFDGLSRGMHIEIKYLDVKSELTVTYRGYLVYSETAGHLNGYAPFPEWEKMIDRLYASAAAIKKSRQKEETATRRLEADRQARTFLQRLRHQWGV